VLSEPLESNCDYATYTCSIVVCIDSQVGYITVPVNKDLDKNKDSWDFNSGCPGEANIIYTPALKPYNTNAFITMENRRILGR
jgi:hypothetical protein